VILELSLDIARKIFQSATQHIEVLTEVLDPQPVRLGMMAVPIENLNPDVLMMEPAEDSYRCDAAELLSRSKIWSIFIQ